MAPTFSAVTLEFTLGHSFLCPLSSVSMLLAAFPPPEICLNPLSVGDPVSFSYSWEIILFHAPVLLFSRISRGLVGRNLSIILHVQRVLNINII